MDTTLLCALIRSENAASMDAQTEFVLKLMTYLTKNRTSDGRERIFYVSAITISELLTREQNSDKIKRLLRLINSKNVEFIDFDLDTALQLNAQLYPYLSKESLHKMAEQVGFKTGDYMLAREWITRDYMIIMSAVSRNADIILTADKNTFYPICEKIGRVDCVLVFPELFEASEQHVLKYYDDKVEEFLKPPPEQPKKLKVPDTKPKEQPKVSPQ